MDIRPIRNHLQSIDETLRRVEESNRNMMKRCEDPSYLEAEKERKAHLKASADRVRQLKARVQKGLRRECKIPIARPNHAEQEGTVDLGKHLQSINERLRGIEEITRNMVKRTEEPKHVHTGKNRK
uniref:Uncharacterized protein n=1 Tax=Steinernema glaseri TaxID=37863 RepID=A0A1I7ZGJ8_9BILA